MKKLAADPSIAEFVQVTASDQDNWKTGICAGILFVYETAALIAVALLGTSVLYFVFLHLIAVFVAWWRLNQARKRNEDLRWPTLMLAALCGGGPIGLGGFLFLMLCYPIACRFATPFSKWLKEIFLEQQVFGEEAIERIKAGWDDVSSPSEMVPFMDIFNFGTLVQKQAVLDAIAKKFDPIFAPLLKNALEDENNSLRVQAAAIVAKINFDFEDKMKKLLKEIPEAKQRPELLLQLAQLFDAHAYTGILTPYMEAENQNRALRNYREYLQVRPDDGVAWAAIGRILFRLKDFEGAVSWFDSYRQKFHELPESALGWYLESLYRLKHYPQLAAAAKEALKQISEEKKKRELPIEIIETIQIWSRYV